MTEPRKSRLPKQHLRDWPLLARGVEAEAAVFDRDAERQNRDILDCYCKTIQYVPVPTPWASSVSVAVGLVFVLHGFTATTRQTRSSLADQGNRRVVQLPLALFRGYSRPRAESPLPSPASR